MGDNTDELKNWITTTEAGRILGVSRRRVLQLVAEGELVAKDLTPRMKLVSRESLDLYRASR